MRGELRVLYTAPLLLPRPYQVSLESMLDPNSPTIRRLAFPIQGTPKSHIENSIVPKQPKETHE